jgi:hypothetical protein
MGRSFNHLCNSSSVELGRELAEFKLDVDKQKFAVTKEDLLVQLQQVQVQHGANVLQLLESAHTLISQRVVTALKGVNVSSVPELKFDESLLNFHLLILLERWI